MITVEQICALPTFLGCDPADVTGLVAAATERRYATGERLCVEGRVATSCFLIVSGEVTATKMTGSTSTEIALFGAGSLFGQVAVLDGKPRSATLTARTPVVTIEIERETFRRMLTEHTPTAMLLQEQVAIASIRQLRRATQRLGAALDAHEIARTSGLDIDYAATGEDLRAIQLAAREWGADVLDRTDLATSNPPPPPRRAR